MGDNLHAAEQWLAENEPRMIHCPYQPGRLRISRAACTKRHSAARRMHMEIAMKPAEGDEVYVYVLRKGFSMCRECQIGKRLADDVLAASIWNELVKDKYRDQEVSWTVGDETLDEISLERGLRQISDEIPGLLPRGVRSTG